MESWSITSQTKSSNFSTDFSTVLLRSQVSYKVGKPIDNSVYCFFITAVLLSIQWTIVVFTDQNASSISINF